MNVRLIVVLTLVAGCSAMPGPTLLAPAARHQVEVVWENHSDDSYVVSIVGRRSSVRMNSNSR